MLQQKSSQNRINHQFAAQTARRGFDKHFFYSVTFMLRNIQFPVAKPLIRSPRSADFAQQNQPICPQSFKPTDTDLETHIPIHKWHSANIKSLGNNALFGNIWQEARFSLTQWVSGLPGISNAELITLHKLHPIKQFMVFLLMYSWQTVC